MRSSPASTAARSSAGDSPGGDIGLYGKQNFGSFYASGIAAYALDRNKTDRYAAGIGASGKETGEFNSNSAIIRIEGAIITRSVLPMSRRSQAFSWYRLTMAV